MQRSSILILGIITCSLLFTMTIGITNVSAEFCGEITPQIYSDQFRLENNSARFYVTALNKSDTWAINLTSVFHGIFYMYIFNFRPQQNYIYSNGTIDPNIHTVAEVYNETPVKINSTVLVNDTVNFIQLNFTANSNHLYYLMIALIGGSAPDSFVLYSNQQIQAYFIPFVPGFPVEWIFLGIGLGISLVWFKHRNTFRYQ